MREERTFFQSDDFVEKATLYTMSMTRQLAQHEECIERAIWNDGAYWFMQKIHDKNISIFMAHNWNK